MCSCSGNCNCNSTTIPRGPQGPTGAAATITVGNVESGSPATVTNSGTPNAAIFNFTIPPGAPGIPGTPGINGKNSYTLTEDVFAQPNDGLTELVQVTDYSWISLNQIIFIGNFSGTSNIGGYYQVTAKTSPDLITVKKLDWTIPGVTFVSAGNNVPGGSLVQSSGTIGATGPAAVERIINDQLAFGTGFPASLNTNITQLNLNGEFITFNSIWSTAEGSDIINTASFTINSISPSLFNASQDPSNQGLYNALIKYDRDPNLNPTGYPVDQDINFLRGDFKITRVSNTILRIIGNVYGHNTNQQNFGRSTFPQKIWTITSSVAVSNTSNFTLNLFTSGDGENSIQLYDILKYNTPNI